jgi:hypothetical protein
MRFSIIAAAFMATGASAEYTVYTTEEITITSCAATVTNCPARSTVTSTTSYAVTSAPVYSNSSAQATYVAVPPTSLKSAVGVAGYPAAGSPAPILSTITISTCVPTVIYSTVTVTPVVTKAAPSSTGTVTYAHNVTVPSATSTPSATPYAASAASSIQGSVFIAALAGVAVFILA